MSLFGILGKKPPSSVTAHILDPKTGYSTQIWTVGQHVTREDVEELSEDGNVFVVVAYVQGQPKSVICKRTIWLQVKAQHDAIDRKQKKKSFFRV